MSENLELIEHINVNFINPVKEQLTEMSKILQDIKIQTTLTNGRVGRLEGDFKDHVEKCPVKVKIEVQEQEMKDKKIEIGKRVWDVQKSVIDKILGYVIPSIIAFLLLWITRLL